MGTCAWIGERKQNKFFYAPTRRRFEIRATVCDRPRSGAEWEHNKAASMPAASMQAQLRREHTACASAANAGAHRGREHGEVGGIREIASAASTGARRARAHGELSSTANKQSKRGSTANSRPREDGAAASTASTGGQRAHELEEVARRASTAAQRACEHSGDRSRAGSRAQRGREHS